MSKLKLLIDKINHRVRAVCFGGRMHDPYVLYHLKPSELEDDRLEELFAEWQRNHDRPEEPLEFEEFIDWLETEHGYISLLVNGAMIHF